MPKRANITFGEAYGSTYWTPLYEAEPYVDSKGNRFRVLHCKCKCGTEKDVLMSNVTQGKSVSCGCHRSELNSRHNMCNKRLYHIWENMIQRCTNKNHGSYKGYGGRGITVCDEWRDFCAFYQWAMSAGYSDDLSIDRIDVDKGYSPDNCRWATTSQQANNKRSSHFLEWDNKRMTVTQWAEFLNVPPNRIHSRLRSGWGVGDALFTPKQVR